MNFKLFIAIFNFSCRYPRQISFMILTISFLIFACFFFLLNFPLASLLLSNFVSFFSIMISIYVCVSSSDYVCAVLFTLSPQYKTFYNNIIVFFLIDCFFMCLYLVSELWSVIEKQNVIFIKNKLHLFLEINVGIISF